MTVIDNDLSLELIQRNRLPWNGFLVVDMSWTCRPGHRTRWSGGLRPTSWNRDGSGLTVPLVVSCLFSAGLGGSNLRYQNYFWPLQATVAAFRRRLESPPKRHRGI